MKQTARIISTYSADVFGVCSALYELGGMTIMHDASGCNSTYTTHDEPRWYDMESMIYISALSEMEAVMGDDAKLVDPESGHFFGHLKIKNMTYWAEYLPAGDGYELFSAYCHRMCLEAEDDKNG